jgi:mannose-6-phosphate isomerase-like protein (cupin superfamily)
MQFDFDEWAAWYSKMPRMFQAQKTKVSADDVETGERRTFPGLFPPGSGMRRFIAAPDLSHRSGYTLIKAGQGFSAFYWYDEYVLAMEGSARLTTLERSSGTTTLDEDLQVNDLVYIPSGTHVSVHNPSTDGQHFLFLWIAIPAPAKHAPWIGAMTPRDIEDIRAQGELTPEGMAEEARRSKAARR